ncbi:DNA binding domain-containing protein, excisionase family [Deinococcus reticulitermitis]|uniref:DNA binding domain-containing protein, excisionase family n=1 Tax=Deinococcus reticulitermitis TaxID=856736 RepID=A0A1H7AWP2_9DEIO|nr:helix-turn-helix domain-containing protein [Deinococcus reticulitermitis]SEJ70021.1 DNA binding domain-containing protein, excisionase family [Deinococcus reticulitermitis]
MTLEEFMSSEFHKVPDVAKFAALGRNTVYAAVNKGELKARRYGNTLRIRTGDALEWLGIELPGGNGAAERQGQYVGSQT